MFIPECSGVFLHFFLHILHDQSGNDSKSLPLSICHLFNDSATRKVHRSMNSLSLSAQDYPRYVILLLLANRRCGQYPLKNDFGYIRLTTSLSQAVKPCHIRRFCCDRSCRYYCLEVMERGAVASRGHDTMLRCAAQCLALVTSGVVRSLAISAAQYELNRKFVK